MKWILVIFLILAVEDSCTLAQRKRFQQQKNRKYDRAYTSATATQNLYGINRPHQQREGKHQAMAQALHATKVQPILEIDMLRCPLSCVCQYDHFKDLPISRWINYMQEQQPKKHLKQEEIEFDNEVTYDNDDAFSTNAFMKQATCILQEDSDPHKLVNTLPHDLQALILLYTDIGRNKTVNLSALKSLNQLNTLEIRGGQDRSLRLIFDEPLSFIQHVNFESVTLLGSDNFKRPENPIHPSDSFDYKPRGEVFDDGDTDEDSKLAFATQETNEILPYDIYVQEVKKARMPTFYGWKHLEVLRIYDCQLRELQWEMFDGLEALQHLSLERNAIADIPAFSFYGAMHIRTLSLASNHIHDLHYRALAGLLELEVLNLRDNRMLKLSERSFPPFPKLQSVDFRGNPITYILPATFWVMNTTRTMFFDSKEQSLELWGNQPFESLVDLQELHIGNVSVTNLEHSIFKGLASLEKLVLKGTIRRIEFDAFAGLTELRELDLSSCGIHEISMDALIGCKNLEVLNLAHNNISYLPPGLFDDQTKLEEIYLQNNQLHMLPSTFFLLPKLRLARLSDNPWQCSCDMNNWRPKITNQERGPRIERCVTDFLTGKRIACRRVDNFNYDNRFTPRCNNYNGRSVFYVLRKQLQCGSGRVVHAKRRTISTNMNSYENKLLHLHLNNIEHTSRQNKENKSTGENKHSPIHQRTWRTPIETRSHRNGAQMNTLYYILQRAPKQSQKHSPNHNAHFDQDISNEI